MSVKTNPEKSTKRVSLRHANISVSERTGVPPRSYRAKQKPSVATEIRTTAGFARRGEDADFGASLPRRVHGLGDHGTLPLQGDGHAEEDVEKSEGVEGDEGPKVGRVEGVGKHEGEEDERRPHDESWGAEEGDGEEEKEAHEPICEGHLVTRRGEEADGRHGDV